MDRVLKIDEIITRCEGEKLSKGRLSSCSTTTCESLCSQWIKVNALVGSCLVHRAFVFLVRYVWFCDAVVISCGCQIRGADFICGRWRICIFWLHVLVGCGWRSSVGCGWCCAYIGLGDWCCA